MNKQIKDLAIKAGASERSMCHGHGDYRTELVMTDEVIEKFAELIVRECVAQCWTVSEIEHKGNVISECSKRMRKHFGVEE